MKTLAGITIALFTMLFLFALLNWTVFSAPATLSLGLMKFDAPVGLFMAGVVVVVSLVYLVFAMGLRTAALMDARRQGKEVTDARRLAGEAESSRVATLATRLEGDITRLEGRITAESASTKERIGASEATLTAALEDAHNRLAATLGELQDRLDSR